MRQYLLLAFASASAIALGSGAQAQTAARTAARPAEEVTLGEIVVTARRRAESLQEVPQTVNAVTSDTLQKLNIRQFQDIQTVAPGLSLQQSKSGFQNTASLRGVTFDVNTGGQIATVATYLNNVQQEQNTLNQTLLLGLLGQGVLTSPAVWLGVKTEKAYDRATVSLSPGVLSADVGDAMHVYELCTDGTLN